MYNETRWIANSFDDHVLKSFARIFIDTCWIRNISWDLFKFLKNSIICVGWRTDFFKFTKTFVTVRLQWPCLRGESHIDFRMQCVIITLQDGGAITNDIWNSERLSNFKAHELSPTANELYIRILRVPNLRSAATHIYWWTLWKNHSSVVSSSK